MTRPPGTLAQFEQLLAKAKSAGLQPIVINGKDGGSVYPLQNLLMDYASDIQAVQDWNFAKLGATINTAATVKAATTLQQWGRAGYLPSDVSTIDQTQAPASFIKGGGVFFPSGNWQAPGLDKAAAGNFGFFLFPPNDVGGRSYAMTASDTLGIAAKSPHADVAAAFLNFIQTDPQARQDTVNLGGIVPAGPASVPAPSAPGRIGRRRHRDRVPDPAQKQRAGGVHGRRHRLDPRHHAHPTDPTAPRRQDVPDRVRQQRAGRLRARPRTLTQPRASTTRR